MKSLLSCLAAVLLLSHSTAAHAQLPPEKALQSFKVSDGLELSLWASEPLFVNPTCMDIDHKGRVWICESINYRQKLRGDKKMRRPEGDRILILDDTKGAGKADNVTVFYQAPEIHSPLGIAVQPHPDGPGCTVYVCQSPDILVFEDKDGDGKADGPPRKLLSGFQGIDHDHGVHSILIGPDNRLYFTVGDAGVRDLQASDKKGRKWSSNGTDCRAGTVWRCDQDGKNLELIAHNFRNDYECAVDSFGTVFLSDNDDDGNQQTRICYVMPGGNYGYHPRGAGQTHWHEEQPGVVPKILRTYFGSPTGICMYEGTLLPKKYHGQLMHVDAGPRHARTYHLTPQGAGYKVVQENMVESTDNWFRPSDICVAPDGAVFIADWYDPGVGGHGMGDVKQGRIYRLVPAGNKPSVPAVDLKTQKGLLAALGSPNLAVRAMAMTEIQRLWTIGTSKVNAEEKANALKVIEGIFRVGLEQKGDPGVRARVIWQLGRLRVPGINNFLARLYGDDDPRLRILALRVAKDCLGTFPHRLVAQVNVHWAEAVSRDPSAAVRREALLLLREADPTKEGKAKAAKMILDLAKGFDGKDRFYLAAIGIAVGQDQKRREVILADFDKHFPDFNEKTAGLLWELRPPQMIGLLEKKLGDVTLPESQRLQIVDILSDSADGKAPFVLLQSLATDSSEEVRSRILANMAQHLPGKWSQLKKHPDLAKAVGQLLDNPKTRAAGLALMGPAQYSDGLSQATRISRDKKETLPVRLAAVNALGYFQNREGQGALMILVVAVPIPELKVAAVRALGRQGTTQALDVLRDLAVDSKSHPLSVRQEAVAGLAVSKEGAALLMNAFINKNLDADLTTDLSRLLRNSPFPEIKKQAQAALPAPPKLDPKKLPSIQALLVRKGSAERGREVMARTLKNDAACLKCHVINKEGGQVGPELSVIGSKASRENLLESILYPHRAVADQYIMWVVETKGGQVINGLLIEDTPEHLLLRDVNAKDHKIAKKDIEAKNKSPNSIMPDNLLLYMSEDELLDVVEYLYSLKSPVLGPVSWRRPTCFPALTSGLCLDARQEFDIQRPVT